MKLASIFSAAAILGVTAVASAQINVIVADNGQVVSTATGQTYQSYTVGLQNVGSSAKISGLDIEFVGTLHNVQSYDSEVPEITAVSVFQNSGALNTANRLAVDSHLLFNSTDLLNGFVAGNFNTSTPDEGLILLPAADGAVRAQGLNTVNVLDPNDNIQVPSNLQTGNSSISNLALRATTINIAQLVVPLNGGVTVTGVASLEGESTPRPIDGFVGIPEPASLGLIGLAGLALARRRMA